MDLPDLKKLAKIIALCRKQGVESIEISGIKITLKDSPPEKLLRAAKRLQPALEEQSTENDGWDSLSEEDKLLWSSGLPASES